jgi:hypothetical protein
LRSPQEDKGLPILRGKILVWAMSRLVARFSLSVKDNKMRTALKVELIEARGLWGERRYRLRVNGRKPANLKEATLTEVFDRLRRWMVRRAD